MQLPKLYENNSFSRFINPISLSLTLNIVPLSTASITMPEGEGLPPRSYVELFTPYGSAGMYRVRAPHDSYGQNSSSAELEHMIAELGDYLVKEEIKQMMPANTAVTKIFSHYKGGHWKLGSVSALGSDTVAVEVNYARVLDSILEVLEQKKDCMMAFDFTTTPWTMSIVKKDTSVTAEGRLSRNVTTATVSYDDSELVTRVWYQTDFKKVDGKSKGTWKSKDASTISKYGVIEATVSTSQDMTDDEINKTVNAYINDHKDPKVSVSIQGLELSKVTGESMDKFVIGKLMRLAVPKYKIVVEQNITSMSWGDIYKNPKSVTVNLGEEEDSVITFLHNLDSKGRGGGGGGGKKQQQEQETIKQFYTDIEANDYRLHLYAAQADESATILRKAGLRINAEGTLIYASDLENSIGSKIQAQSDKISLVVVGHGKDAKVNAAQIVLGINNQTGSYIKLKADKINLTGYVTVSKLEAVEAKFNNLISGRASATLIKAGSLQTGTLRVGGVLYHEMSKWVEGVGFINYLGH